MTKREYDSTQYRKNRKIVLADEPMCHYCRRRKATTVDHIIEVDRGGTSDLGNMVPACSPCNSKKGQSYLTAKNRARTQAREHALHAAEQQRHNQQQHPDFLDSTPYPPRATREAISPEGLKDSNGSGHDLRENWSIGCERPRLETLDIGEDSYGPLVVAWARKYLGVELFPWQRYALDRMLRTKPTSDAAVDDLFHRESHLGCARQQGKTVLLGSLCGWWLTDFAAMRGKPQNVLSSAHKLLRAEEVGRYIFPILQEYFGAKPMWSSGRMSCEMPDKSKWEISAAAPSAAHGGSYDLIAADETWSVAPTVVLDGYRPSQIARRSPLLAMFSTAGDESSTLLLQVREQALANIDAKKPSPALFMEWSIPPTVDPYDERYWRFSNPSLGHGTITIEALRLAAQSPDRSSFLRGHLNLFLSSAKSWLPSLDAWEKCQFDGPIPAGGVLAIEHSVDAQRLVATRAAAFEDGSVGVTVAFVVDNEPEMWERVSQIMEDRAVKLAGPPSLEIHVPEHLRNRWTTVGHGEIMKWTSVVRTMIAEQRIRATREEMFAQHVARAVGVKTATGYIVSSQKSSGPIELCRTMIWSVALASVPRTLRKPTIATARK